MLNFCSAVLWEVFELFEDIMYASLSLIINPTFYSDSKISLAVYSFCYLLMIWLSVAFMI